MDGTRYPYNSLRCLLVILSIFLSSPLAFGGRFDTRGPGALFEDCAGKILRSSIRQFYRVDAFFRGLESSHQRRLTLLASFPRRKLVFHPKVLDYIESHPVYVSVTTSPQRISHLAAVLRSIDTEHVSEVLVVLPERFGRNGMEYLIPPELLDIPKVKILRIPNDLGPASKLLPAAEYLLDHPDQPVLITIDDDIIYPMSMVNELIAASSAMPEAAVGGVGAPLSRWDIFEIPSQAMTDYFWNGDIGFRHVDVLEGYAAALYPVNSLPLEDIAGWLELGPECRYSDDILISMALRKSKIKRYEMRSRFYSRDYLYPLPHGYLEDALHRGAGLPAAIENGFFTAHNHSKYRRSVQLIRDAEPAWKP